MKRSLSVSIVRTPPIIKIGFQKEESRNDNNRLRASHLTTPASVIKSVHFWMFPVILSLFSLSNSLIFPFASAAERNVPF